MLPQLNKYIGFYRFGVELLFPHLKDEHTLFDAGISLVSRLSTIWFTFLWLVQGWGVHVSKHISKDSAVCEYVGEIVTTREATHRLQEYDKCQAKRGHGLLVRFCRILFCDT